MQAMREAYNLLFSNQGTLRERVAEVADKFGGSPEVMEIVDFIRAEADRAICLPRHDRAV